MIPLKSRNMAMIFTIASPSQHSKAGEEDRKLNLFAEVRIVFIENPKKYAKNLVELTSK